MGRSTQGGGRWALAAAAIGLALAAAHARAVPPETMAYVHPVPTSTQAYLYEPLPDGRARVVTPLGVGEGRVSQTPGQWAVTLDAPISLRVAGKSPCPDQQAWTQRREIHQIIFSPLPGPDRTEVREVGRRVALDGCHAGQVWYFGRSGGRGTPMLHQAFSRRAPTDDLLPGVQLAGMSQAPAEDGSWNSLPTAAVDRVAFLADNQLQFVATGLVVPAARDDGWWMLDLGVFQRGYTRLSVNRSSGAERWLRAEMRAGHAQAVHQALMVKFNNDYFGPPLEVLRVWRDVFSYMLPLDQALAPWDVTYRLYARFGGQQAMQVQGLRVNRALGWALGERNLALCADHTTHSVSITTWQPLTRVQIHKIWVIDGETLRTEDRDTIVRPNSVRLLYDDGPTFTPGSAPDRAALPSAACPTASPSTAPAY